MGCLAVFDVLHVDPLWHSVRYSASHKCLIHLYSALEEIFISIIITNIILYLILNRCCAFRVAGSGLVLLCFASLQISFPPYPTLYADASGD